MLEDTDEDSLDLYIGHNSKKRNMLLTNEEYQAQKVSLMMPSKPTFTR